jgi:hypothetical protein
MIARRAALATANQLAHLSSRLRELTAIRLLRASR